MTSRKTRHRPLLAAAASLLAVGAACEPTEPPPPPPPLVVNTLDDLSDAVPGDGVCEATPGAGDCSVRAAVEEGNALGQADLALGDAEYQFSSPLVVTGTLHLTGVAPIRTGLVGNGGTQQQLHVAAGGVVTLDDVYVRIDVVVDGALVVRRSSLQDFHTTALTVGAGGAVLVQNAAVASFDTGDPAIVNGGTLVLDHADVGGTFFARFFTTIDLGAVSTSPGAVTTTRGSWLASGCEGEAPVSLGYNAFNGAGCGLSETGDVGGAAALQPSAVPQLGSRPPVLVDAVPVGEINCGTFNVVDGMGDPRPADGDGDGTAACDIGATERPAP